MNIVTVVFCHPRTDIITHLEFCWLLLEIMLVSHTQVQHLYYLKALEKTRSIRWGLTRQQVRSLVVIGQHVQTMAGYAAYIRLTG